LIRQFEKHISPAASEELLFLTFSLLLVEFRDEDSDVISVASSSSLTVAISHCLI
jgi:hypothetical protein